MSPTASVSPRRRSAVAAFKAEARALLKPTPVRHRRMPSWFRCRLLKALRGRRQTGASTAAWAIAVDLQQVFGVSLDHWGTAEFGGEPSFVIEAYDFTANNAFAYQHLADRLGCRWVLSPNSWHFPGRTFRAIFFEDKTPEPGVRSRDLP